MSGCVTVPKEVKPSESKCQLSTKQYTLALHGNSKPYLLKCFPKIILPSLKSASNKDLIDIRAFKSLS